jgi:hypothetical protein
VSDLRTQIIQNLSAFFDSEDEFFKIFFADTDGTIPAIINKPTDLEIGFTASIWEYTRRLSIDLEKQMYLDKASEDFLKFMLVNFFDTPRLENESLEAWVARVISKVLMPKVSKAAIIYALREFSSPDADIIGSISSGMFAGSSFASRYKSFSGNFPGIGLKQVFPAIVRSYSFSLYFMTIVVYNVQPQDILSVVGIIEEVIAAGIGYTLEVKST